MRRIRDANETPGAPWTPGNGTPGGDTAGFRSLCPKGHHFLFIPLSASLLGLSPTWEEGTTEGSGPLGRGLAAPPGPWLPRGLGQRPISPQGRTKPPMASPRLQPRPPGGWRERGTPARQMYKLKPRPLQTCKCHRTGKGVGAEKPARMREAGRSCFCE